MMPQGGAMLLRSSDTPSQRWLLAALIVVFGVIYAQYALKIQHADGNVNVLILFLIVMSLLAFCHHRDGLAGFLLGLSIACKLTPALFLAYFLYKRAWTTLAGAALGLVLFMLIIPGAYFGWRNN